MSPRKTDPLTAALADLTGSVAPGPFEVHVNLVIDAATDRVVTALIESGRASNRSKALRLLQLEGARRMLDEIRTPA